MLKNRADCEDVEQEASASRAYRFFPVSTVAMRALAPADCDALRGIPPPPMV